jgi:hypothetical protein
MMPFGGVEPTGANPRRDPFKSSGMNSFPFSLLYCASAALQQISWNSHSVQCGHVCAIFSKSRAL